MQTSENQAPLAKLRLKTEDTDSENRTNIFMIYTNCCKRKCWIQHPQNQRLRWSCETLTVNHPYPKISETFTAVSYLAFLQMVLAYMVPT